MFSTRDGIGLEPPTNSEDKVVVRLVVDFIQDVKHVNSKVSQCAKVGGDGLLSLGMNKWEHYVWRVPWQEDTDQLHQSWVCDLIATLKHSSPGDCSCS